MAPRQKKGFLLNGAFSSCSWVWLCYLFLCLSGFALVGPKLISFCPPFTLFFFFSSTGTTSYKNASKNILFKYLKISDATFNFGTLTIMRGSKVLTRREEKTWTTDDVLRMNTKHWCRACRVT